MRLWAQGAVGLITCDEFDANLVVGHQHTRNEPEGESEEEGDDQKQVVRLVHDAPFV